MMTCAPLAKSPNCASHITSALRLGEAVAVFEAEHGGFRQRAVEHLERRLSRARHAAAGCISPRSPGRSARRGAARRCRGPNPGRTDARTCLRRSSVPKASASAVAQSTPSPRFDRLALLFELAHDLAVEIEVRRARCVIAAPTSRSNSIGTDGLAAPIVARRHREAAPRAFEPVGLVRACSLSPLRIRSSSWAWKSAAIFVDFFRR